MRETPAIGLLALACFLLFAQPVKAQSASFFSEITKQARLDFQHEPGDEGKYAFPEIMGSGLALFDYDGDGDLDVYFIQAGGAPEPRDKSVSRAPNRLFRQDPGLAFTDVTAESGLGDTGYGTGVAVGDIDNDGRLDVYVGNYGTDALYHNEGGGKFVDVTRAAGIRGDHWSASAVFCDFDGDGFLDLYVTHYVTNDPTRACVAGDGSPDYCSPQSFPGTPDTLYRNDGDGTFTDVSKASGIAAVAAPGLGVVCLDFNRDGRMDFYVANDGEANQLWLNQGGGKFADEAFLNGVALNGMGQPEAGMGITVGDADGDRDLDFFITHLKNQHNTLYRREGEFGFEDLSNASGLASVSLALTGFGTGFIDVEHDGDLDLAIVNGRVDRSSKPIAGAEGNAHWSPYAEPNLLMENTGDGHFREICPRAGSFCSRIEVSRGLAFGDLDEDGDLDMVMTNTAGPARFFRNDAPKKGSWLLVRVVDPALHRDVYGAEVTVRAGGKEYVRVANPGYSYLSSNDPRAHFGLPGAIRADWLRVRFPDGTEETFPGGALNRNVALEKGKGKAAR